MLQILGDVAQAPKAHDDEPQRGDRTEEGRHLSRAITLDGEEADQDGDAQGQHVRTEGWRDELQALDGG